MEFLKFVSLVNNGPQPDVSSHLFLPVSKKCLEFRMPEIEFPKELTTRRIKKDEADVQSMINTITENGQPLGI